MIRRLVPLLALLLASAAAGPASADPGIAVRARPGGLAFVAGTVRDLVPSRVDLPPLGDSGGISITGGRADIDMHSVDLVPHDGQLEVRASLDLHVSGLVDAGFTQCDIDIYAQPVGIGATVDLGTSPQGKVVATAVALNIDLTADQFELDSHGCFLGDVVEAVLGAAEAWALEKATGLLEDVAGDLILPKLQDAIEQLGSLELQRDGFTLQGGVTRVDLDAADGMSVAIDGQVQWTGPVDPSLDDPGEPPTEAPIGAALPAGYGPGDFALAASDQVVTRALYQAWRGGLFAQLLSGLSPDLALDEGGLAAKLGLPAGTTVGVAIAVGAPPTVSFGRGPDATGVRIGLEQLVVTATITAPGAPSSTLVANVDGVLGARVALDPGAGALAIEPTDLTITRLDVTAGSESLNVDPARLAAFIEAVAVPALSDVLAGIPIAPALQPVDGVFAIARDMQTKSGWLRVAADLYRPDPNDRTAPDTELVRPPSVVSPALARFAVTGTDDTTPPELLRYLVVLDGVAQTTEPAFGSTVRVSAAEGNHVVEIRAVDLAGHEDLTPAVHSFYVDGTPPELALTAQPDDVIGGDQASFAWTAGDDRTPALAVETRWELRKVAGGEGRGEVVASDDFTAGRLSADLGDLDANGLYVFTVVARDEAGNVTSVEYGFAVQPGGGGCSAGGSAAPWLIVLLALGLVVARRRRRAVALVAAAGLLAVAAPARAQGIGTTLSGPTDGDGAAAFWNPAAMLRGHGTRVDVGSGLSLIRATYVPTDRTDGSATFVPKPEPTVGMVSDALGPRWRLGFTMGVPQIDGASWSRTDGAADITRWYAVDARTFHVTLTPAVAFRPAPWISVGAGINIVRSQITATLDKDMGKQLNQAAGSPVTDSPFPYADPSMAAPLALDATGWSVGAVAGVMLRPVRRVTLGASIHTASTSRAHGAVDVEYPEAMRNFVAEAAPAAQLPELSGDIEVPLSLPLMVFAAAAVEPADGWELRADYRFLDRSQVSDVNIIVVEATSPDVKDTNVVRGYRDRHSVGLRASRRLLEGRALVAARARYEPNSLPESTTAPNNLDFDKLELGLAARFALSARTSLVGMYSHYFMPDRVVDDSLHQPLAEPTLDAFNHPSPTGTYGATADYVAFALSVAM